MIPCAVALQIDADANEQMGGFTILKPSLETPVEWQHGVRRHPTPGGH